MGGVVSEPIHAGKALVTDGSGEMFDRIAKKYDRLNLIMSMGMDRWWRRGLIKAVGGSAPALGGRRFLDVATGTADVALALARAYPGCDVVGVDPSVGMLGVGREKVAAKGLADRISLVEGDAQAMAFEDAAFDGVTIAFGIRNVPDRALGLREMARVTRPGGRVAVLELGEPREGLLSPLVRFHIRHVVPRLGAWLSGEKEYRYLQESIAAFPQPAAFAEVMESAGLTVERVRRFAFGAANLYIGRR